VIAIGLATAELAAANFALKYDGTNDFARIASPSGIPLGNSSYTQELWMKVNDWQLHNPYSMLMIRGDEGYQKIVAMAVVSPSNNFCLAHWLPDTDTGVGVALNTWTHMATTYDGSTQVETLYVNGDPAWSNDWTGGFPGGWQVPASSITLGKHDNFDQNYFAGVIDEVRIWNVVRSGPEIKANYDQAVSPLAPGLVTYWNFDEGSGQSAADLSPSGNTIVLGAGLGVETTDPTWVTGHIPEPATLSLLTLGGLALIRRRKRNS